MVPFGPFINTVWFLPVLTALYSTLYDLFILGSGKLLVRLFIHVLCWEGEEMEQKKNHQSFEARKGTGSINSGDGKSQAQPDRNKS